MCLVFFILILVLVVAIPLVLLGYEAIARWRRMRKVEKAEDFLMRRKTL